MAVMSQTHSLSSLFAKAVSQKRATRNYLCLFLTDVLQNYDNENEQSEILTAQGNYIYLQTQAIVTASQFAYACKFLIFAFHSTHMCGKRTETNRRNKRSTAIQYKPQTRK